MLAGVAPAGLKPIATAARLDLATLPRCEQTVAAATNGCLRWFKASDDFAQVSAPVVRRLCCYTQARGLTKTAMKENIDDHLGTCRR